MLRYKPGVTTDGLQPEGQEIIRIFEEISNELGIDLTITSTTKDHGAGDPHPAGFACDVRTLDLKPEQIVQVFRKAWQKLGSEHYTVRFEAPPAEYKLLPEILKEIASINSGASAVHLHTQVKKGLWQQILQTRQAASA